MKKKIRNFDSFTYMQTKRTPLESRILALLKNTGYNDTGHFSAEFWSNLEQWLTGKRVHSTILIIYKNPGVDVTFI